MPVDVLRCGNCQGRIPAETANTGQAACPACRTPYQLAVFPAAFHTPDAPEEAEPLLDAEGASCYVHGDRAAAACCDGCGKFLCRLCDVAALGGHYCTTCLETIQADPARQGPLNAEYRRWEVLAGYLTIPLIIPVIGWICSPVALFLAVLGWRSPRSPVNRRRVLAGTLILVNGVAVGLTAFFFIMGVLSIAGVVE